MLHAVSTGHAHIMIMNYCSHWDNAKLVIDQPGGVEGGGYKIISENCTAC